MRLKLVREAFDNADFIFELKHDGFRGLVYLEGFGSNPVGHRAYEYREVRINH